MNINIQWHMITALCAVIGGSASLMGFLVRALVKDEFRKLRAEITGVYVFAQGSNITGYEIEHRLNTLEGRCFSEPSCRKELR